MAYTAHKDPEQVEEIFTDEDTVTKQAQEIAQCIKCSKHFVAFTGAGISTSAGIPDFRGPNGVWTLRAQGKAPTGGRSTTTAIPTPTHMALVALQKSGHLKFLISQNCDGLHRRSGFPAAALAELHGNTNLEYCEKCGKDYLRDFSVRNHANHVHEHATGRRCCACSSELKDSIINFGENLPHKPLKNGFHNSQRSDFYLVLGSSLTVTPAANMPKEAAENGAKLAICNLQKTPLDKFSKIRVFAQTDRLMEKVCEFLGVDIDKWLLRRRIQVYPTNNKEIIIKTVDIDGTTPATILRDLKISVCSDSVSFDVKKDGKSIRDSSVFTLSKLSVPCSLLLELHFMGHYMEPETKVVVDVKSNHVVTILLAYDVSTRQWTTSTEDSVVSSVQQKVDKLSIN